MKKFIIIFICLIGINLSLPCFSADSWVKNGIDFEPYMKGLQRDIKSNWNPPKSNECRRVILLLKIAKDGKLLKVEIYKSSENAEMDAAALNATLATKLKPLPRQFKGDSVDIQFTFDYKIFGNKGLAGNKKEVTQNPLINNTTRESDNKGNLIEKLMEKYNIEDNKYPIK